MINPETMGSASSKKVLSVKWDETRLHFTQVTGSYWVSTWEHKTTKRRRIVYTMVEAECAKPGINAPSGFHEFHVEASEVDLTGVEVLETCIHICIHMYKYSIRVYIHIHISVHVHSVYTYSYIAEYSSICLDLLKEIQDTPSSGFPIGGNKSIIFSNPGIYELVRMPTM